MDLAINRRTLVRTGGVVTGLEALAQRVFLRLSRLRGEWFLDLDSGLPVEVLGSKPLRIERLRAQVTSEVMDVAGVIEVSRLEISDVDRAVSVSLVVRGELGTIGVTV